MTAHDAAEIRAEAEKEGAQERIEHAQEHETPPILIQQEIERDEDQSEDGKRPDVLDQVVQ